MPLPSAAVEDSVVTVENTSFFYDSFQALKNIDFTISRGSITALVGPNGAGKSTLLFCLAALRSPHNGSITVNGYCTYNEPRDCHKQIGFLPDAFGLYPRLSGRQGLEYFGAAHGRTDLQNEEQIEMLIELLGLEEFIDKSPRDLSRGQRQRMGIAHAMIHDPDILLLDEPASGLDPESRDQLSKSLLVMQQAGKTILVSSHILAELEDYATDMLIIEKGQIVEHYAPHTTLSDQPTRWCTLEFTAGWDGSLETLRELEGVKEVILEDATHVNLAIKDSENAQVQLIRMLSEHQLPVLQVLSRGANMKKRYLQRNEGGS